MKNRFSSDLLLGMLGTWLFLGGNAMAEINQVPPGQAWKVVAKESQKLTLTENAGVLEIQYDLAIDTVKQVGILGVKQGTAELRLPEPIRLGQDQVRVFFEANGINTAAASHGETAILLRPILRDSLGTLFYYFPLEYPHLNTGTTGWSLWMTPDFHINEAGGPSDQLYEAQGKAGNVTPQGDLAFLGFQLVACAKTFGRKTGKIALGEIDFRGSVPPYLPPFAYVDSLLPNKEGKYVIGAAVRNEFQGVPLREFKQEIAYHPADLASSRQKMIFPLGPDDVYWIDYQVLDDTGHAVAKDSLQNEAVGTGEASALKPIDLTQPPVVGQMRVNPVAHGNGVYAADEKPEVTVRLFGTGTRTLSWELLAFAFDTVLASGSIDGSASSGPFRDVTIPLQWQPGRDAYRLKLTLKEGDTVLDQQTYVLGRTTDLTKPYGNRLGAAVDRAAIKEHSYSRVTYVGNRAAKSEYAAMAEFNRELEDISSLTRNITCLIEATDLEILPGVYDFALVDRMVDAAADHGCSATFRLTVESGKQFPWQKYCRTRSSDGLEMRIGHKTQILPVASDPRYLAIYDRGFKSLHDRYGTHPGYQGVYLMTAVGDWGDAYADLPWIGTISGYDPASRIAFRTYLKDKLHLSLAQLNERWGTAYKTWEEIEPPLPDFKLDGKPQLSRNWLDFCEFKTSWSKEWFQHLATTIRAYDPNHIIICYTTKPDGLLGVADYLHNGGNQFLRMEGTLIDAWENHRLGWISEPNHPYRWAAYGDPAEKGWVLDWSLYIATAQAGGGGWNPHLYYDPHPSKDAAVLYGGAVAFDRFAKFEIIGNELRGIRMVKSQKEVATLQDIGTLYGKHRTANYGRMEDLNRWFELLKNDSVQFEDFQADHLGQYKLVVLNLLDEVLSQKHIDDVDQVVRNGGKLIMGANTGKYCSDHPNEKFPLLRKLGITPPEGEYVLTDSAVSAQVEKASALFPLDDKIPFYARADQKLDHESGKLKDIEAFQKWPYRWVPETDYFGYYRENKTTNGEVLARFPSGGVALSLHQVGKGQVLVFWGTPDVASPALKGMMARVAKWAGVNDPLAGSPIPHVLEADSADPKLGRHYAFLYQEIPGTYQEKFPYVPDGKWLIDDMVTDEKLGTYTGKELREQGMSLVYGHGFSPFKILRMLPLGATPPAAWVLKYRQPVVEK